jgi:hypothetical protein
MDDTIRTLIAQLHAAPVRYAVVLTGGGAGAAGWLLSVPGGSRTVLEVAVPYDETALAEYLGRRPESFCSTETARALAARALERAHALAPGHFVAGVSCTASLRSDRPKRGEHRFHIAVQTSRRVVCQSLTLKKDARDRAAEEDVLDRVLLNALAEKFDLLARVPVLLLPGEELTHEAARPGLLASFLAGEVETVGVEPDGRVRAGDPLPGCVLPGSFNPLHHGHLTLAAAARSLTGVPVGLELSVVNVDKPALADEEVRRRVAQVAWQAPLWLTREPTFAGKSRLFPGCTFVVGADTAARVVQPRYYGGEPALVEAIAALRQRRCKFLVAGRRGGDGAFVGLDALAIPDGLRDLFTAIPEGTFRADVSSSELRGEG